MKKTIVLAMASMITCCNRIDFKNIPCGTKTYTKTGVLNFKKSCSIDGRTFSIDSFYDNGIEVVRSFEPENGIEHYYFNDKNRYLEYRLFYEERSMFSVIRMPGGYEKVSGNNIVVLDKQEGNEKYTDKVYLYIGYPSFTETVLLSLFEVSKNGYVQSVIEDIEVKKHKNLIEYEKNYDCYYYVQIRLMLNSNKTYIIKSNV
jgi:hypothetical protein